MRLVHPEIGGLLLFVLGLTWLVSRRRVTTLGHSELGIHTKLFMPFAGRLSTVCFAGMWLMLAVALCQPELITPAETQPVLARNIVITVDNSGSMLEFISTTSVPLGNSYPSAKSSESKSDAAKAGVKYFIEQRPDDRIALLTFGDQVFYVWPLTTDHAYLLGLLDVIKGDGTQGTNFAGPIGLSKIGAIEGSIIHLRETDTLAGKVVIIVTDGEDSIPQERRIELENELVHENISLYVLGVGWDVTRPHDLATLVKDIGGKVILVDDAPAMMDAFAQIDKIEKGVTYVDGGQIHHDFYQWFVYAAIALLGGYLLSVTFTHEDT
ncbi:hypothetical protein BH10CYA1_BH10CYA1_17550 [soil metagenome]